MGKKVTLKDIAQATGVTSASVSMILNGKDLHRFSPELITKVLLTARSLHYVPPGRNQDKKQIAILSPSVNNPYHTTIIMGIERAALANGYLTGVYNTYWNPETERTLLNVLAKQNAIAGIIYVMNPLQTSLVSEVNRHSPVVAVGDLTGGELDIDTVDINNFRAGEMVGEHLIALGHRHIAYLTTSLNDPHVARVRRCEGLQSAYERLCPEGSVSVFCKMNEYEQEIQSPDIELESGRELALECLRDPKITAIVAINDMVGYGVLDTLLEQGLRIPEDYSLCGFDNIFPSRFHGIQMTTVDLSTVYQGARAFHLLKEKMENPQKPTIPYPITRVEYRSQLVLRGTTGAPRASAMSPTR